MHQVTIRANGRDVTTLADIVPETRPVKMLIVAKTPAPVSVATGHYFQGRQGRMFWNRLKEWNLLNLLDAPTGSFEGRRAARSRLRSHRHRQGAARIRE